MSTDCVRHAAVASGACEDGYDARGREFMDRQGSCRAHASGGAIPEMDFTERGGAIADGSGVEESSIDR